MDIFNQFETRLKEKDALSRIISVNHIPELQTDIDRLYNNSFIDEKFYQSEIKHYFDYSIIDKNPAIQSLIIIATPSPVINVRFNLNGTYFRSIIPPMYADKRKVNQWIMYITNQLFKEKGYTTFPVTLPKKLIAVRSGLASYGKNNICYIQGMGSYHRLTLFASDLPCHHDSWQDIKMLERCNRCMACINHCPTGALKKDRFITHAEKCLTHFNEHMDSFPDWIEAGWHNSIIGCMHCQSICPENKNDFTIPGMEIEFTKSETRLILKNVPFNELPESTQSKFYGLCMDRYYPQVSRNLNILFKLQMS